MINREFPFKYGTCQLLVRSDSCEFQMLHLAIASYKCELSNISGYVTVATVKWQWLVPRHICHL